MHAQNTTRVVATQILKREFETIRMLDGEDPPLFLGRKNKTADQLALLGCSKSVEEVNQHIIRYILYRA